MSAAQGVYFRRQDYLGVGRRLLIDVIDFPVAVLLWYAAGQLARPLVTEPEGLLLLLLCAVWFAYFVLLKRSRFRTLGYVAAGARIVSLEGGRPGIMSLVARLLFALAGPLNFVIDIAWLTGELDARPSATSSPAPTWCAGRPCPPGRVRSCGARSCSGG
jgi:uncharacterized RDD family membrane protein YckC